MHLLRLPVLPVAVVTVRAENKSSFEDEEQQDLTYEIVGDLLPPDVTEELKNAILITCDSFEKEKKGTYPIRIAIDKTLFPYSIYQVNVQDGVYTVLAREPEEDDGEKVTPPQPVKDPEPAFLPLKARIYKAANTSITIKWNKISGATGYTIYAAQCGKKKTVKIATVKGKTSRKITGLSKGTKLKKGTYYRIEVVAVKGSRKLAVSGPIYISTTGGKTTNVKALTLNKTKVTVR